MLARSAVALLVVSFFPVVTHAAPQQEPVVAPLGSDLPAIQETLRLPRATAYNDADGDKLFDSLEERFRLQPVLTTVITLRHDADFQAAKAKLYALGIVPTHSFAALKMFAAELRADQAIAAAHLDAVRQVEWAQPGQAELDTATVNFGVRSIQQDLGITGSLDGDPETFSSKDVVIAILDSGFDGLHVDLAGKFLAFFDTKDGKLKSPYDYKFHGTHVAGIAGGLGKGKAELRGVAPGAAFVGIKIEEAEGGPKVGALSGVNWLLENHKAYNVRVSTISYGFGFTLDGTDALEIAFDKLFESGVLPFKSTGNSGPEPGTVTIPGGARGVVAVANMFDPGRTENPTPSEMPVVGSAEYDYGFRLASSSSRGPTADNRVKPDIAAPGSSINAVAKGSKDGYRVLSGTSMASPFAAGSAALVIAADTTLTPSQVRDILFATAEDWGAKGPDSEYGVGRLDTLRAVQKALLGRALREQLGSDEIQRIASVKGPDVPFHAGGVLTDVLGSTSFEIKNPKQPLAVTLIHHAPSAPGVWKTAPLHAAILELKGPDGSVVKRGLTPTERQQSLALVPTQAGKYTIEAKDLVKGSGLVFDVSAGLPPVELPVLPELVESAKAGGKNAAKPLNAGDRESTPSPGLLLAIVAVTLGAAVAAGRRTR